MADIKNKKEYAKSEYSKEKAKNQKQSNNKDNGKENPNAATKTKKPFAYHLIPYVFAVLAIWCILCFVANAFCNPENMLLGGRESEHTLGLVGFYFCYGLLGTFGYAAYFMPVILILFVVFWKKYDRRSFVATNMLVGFVSVSAISALCHTFMYMSGGREGFSSDISQLFLDGAAYGGGGVVGGLLSFGLVYILSIVGTIFVLVAILIPLLLFLFGTTPVEAAVFIGKRIKKSYKAACERAKLRKAHKAEDKKAAEEKKRLELLEAKEAKRIADAEEKEQKRLALEQAKLEEAKLKEEEQKALNAKEDTCIINIPTFASEEDVDEEEIKLNAFSDDQVSRDDELKTENGVDDSENKDEEDELDTSVMSESEKTVVFVKDGTKKKNTNTVDDMLNDLFDDDEETAIEEEAGDDLDIELEDEDDEEDDVLVFEESRPAPVQVPEYRYPPVELLEKGSGKYASDPVEIEANAQKLRNVLQEFGIEVKEINCSCGPTITRYEVKLEAGIRVKKIVNLVDDISYALASKFGVRIEAPIPGKTAVGIEVPNEQKFAVNLRTIIENPEFTENKSKIASCLGADVAGHPVVFDIEKMPHLLVAGTTGSGKSVCINSIIMSILYRAKPSEVKLLLIDPKKVEFKVYKDIPHLCCRIVSNPKKAAGALNSAVNEMEKRFELIEEVGVRNITGYNEITKNDPDKPYMPRLVIIIDEFADLMMTAKDEVETAVCRIAQKARAAGIHLIIGTQRPSVDVITGLIKANIPSRIAFTVMSQVDSRTIIDMPGAEKLCGRGDMLFSPVGMTKPLRVQGAFVSDEEVERVVEYVRENNAPVVYDSEFEMSIDVEAAKCGSNGKSAASESNFSGGSGDEDAKLYDAVDLAIDAGKISTSLLQRRLEVGYGRAAKIIDRMEELGYVGPADGNKPRKILITREEFSEKMMNR